MEDDRDLVVAVAAEMVQRWGVDAYASRGITPISPSKPATLFRLRHGET